MNGFRWRESGGDWLLFHKDFTYGYIGIIHPRLSTGEYYVDIYFSPKLRTEFLEKDLDVAKLKAEIKSAEFIKKGES